MIKEFRLPDLGEGLTESEIVAWKVAVGDTVALNQIIAEVETAKAVVELPSPFAGVVTALHEQPGTVVEVGKPIVSFEVEGDDGGRRRSGAGGAGADAPAKREPNLVGYGAVLENSGRPARRARSFAARGAGGWPSAGPPPRWSSRSRRAAPVVRRPRRWKPCPRLRSPAERPRSTPPVRKLAKDLGVDLAAVTGTGEHGLITRDDVRNFVGGGDLPAAPQDLAGAPAQARPSGAGRAGNPHADQGRPEVHGRRHGLQRLHRAARHGVPDRRRHPHHGTAGEAQGQPRVCRLQAHAADPRGQGRADRPAATTPRSTPGGTRPTRRSSSSTT